MKVLFDQGPVDGSSDNHEPEDLGERGFTSLEEAPESLRPPRETRTPGWAGALMIDDAEFIARVQHYNLMDHPTEPLPDVGLNRKEIGGRPFLPSERRDEWAAERRPLLVEEARKIGSSVELRDHLEHTHEKLRLISTLDDRCGRAEETARRHQSKKRLQMVQFVREHVIRIQEFYRLKQSVFRDAASRLEAGLTIRRRPDRKYEDRLVAVLKAYDEGKGVREICKDAAEETEVGESWIRKQLKNAFKERHGHQGKLERQTFGEMLKREAKYWDLVELVERSGG
jgi:hypothetical protein